MSAYQLSEEAGNVIPLGYPKGHVAANSARHKRP